MLGMVWLQVGCVRYHGHLKCHWNNNAFWRSSYIAQDANSEEWNFFGRRWCHQICFVCAQALPPKMECNNPPTDSSIHHHLAANLLEQVLLVSFVLLSMFSLFLPSLAGLYLWVGKDGNGEYNWELQSWHSTSHPPPLSAWLGVFLQESGLPAEAHVLEKCRSLLWKPDA